MTLVLASPALAADARGDANLWFDPGFISGNSQAVADLSRFQRRGAQLPGSYLVDFWLNGQRIDNRTIRFIARPADSVTPSETITIDNNGDAGTIVRDDTGLMACVSAKELQAIGVKSSALTDVIVDKGDSGDCPSLESVIPGAKSVLDFQKMRLYISVPQAALVRLPSGWIAPDRWDEGIDAGLLSYRVSGSTSRAGNSNSSDHYFSAISGFNLGAWRVRDSRSWSDYNNRLYHYQKWEHQSTYVERALIPWRSEMTVGDTNTNGDVFDALGVRGLQLATDENMYPYSLRGYAPVIRGTASTNAQVTVRQNGYTIYQTSVAPGAFVISDLTPSSAGSDLEVTVKEASGPVRSWVVPYSSLPILQRQGFVKYSVFAGRYRSADNEHKSPPMAEGTMVWGLPYGLTVFGGLQYTQRYRSTLIGTGVNMGKAGALSADVTEADSRLVDGSRHKGGSLRILYARTFNATGSTLQVTGFRYSTKGFYTLEETALKDMQGCATNATTVPNENYPISYDCYDLDSHRRQLLQASLSQRVGNSTNVYLTGSNQTYWKASRSTTSLQLGLSGAFRHVNYNLSYSMTRAFSRASTDRTLYLSLSMPLDFWRSHNGSSSPGYVATLTTTQDNEGSRSFAAGVSGTALEDASLNWSVSQSRASGDKSGDASINHQGAHGNASLGYSYSNSYQQFSYSFSGGALLHRNGLTMGQSLGDTNILVTAPGAYGVAPANTIGVRTDRRGYAVVPYASAYQENRVALDLTTLAGNTDIENAVASVVPTLGAVVRAKFVAHTGARALITLTHKGAPLPFGTTVSSSSSSGIVADNGEVFLSGLAPSGTLRAEWGDGPDHQCLVQYTLPEGATSSEKIVILTRDCSSSIVPGVDRLH
ncbi:fimbria/pilus outer membrane usher protein [Xanthomonas cassavae CFBP 4642]|uniref:Fimbria/pilus outer membrane usher protein n=2 Tax=Xanthomonas cassavae TaxID=56450 RepID=A0ABS8HLL0_9XANT|nr:fimbria/pilus outer membrane usher protein [Xanthomonas cassavae]MCC4622569.1 fimbria/pilus outer membrane usher protein [Xanthomonas cassavae CFBP 4642]